MQEQNQNNHPLSPFSRVANSIVKLINSISQSFQLQERELLIRKQWVNNLETSNLLKEQQEFINQANQRMPILLTSKSRLIILEAILVAHARDGQPIDDVVTAIEVLRKNILELDTSSNVNLQNQPPVHHQPKDPVITHRHQYDFPILSEVGGLITDARNLILLVPLIAAFSALILPITNPRLCNSWENSSGTYENKSLYCQFVNKLNSLFSDYQKME
ncbi:hypothetical protein H6G80_31355 [Nostoc sp. FACHB-87]|uniref:hypothetical protein n=1 Tax=Nostocales TaxID=1161 RepID=UPI00168548A9|nr:MULTISPECIES: hypothetical protein [Nostocales]MBD2302604.1 hypothetical protein [Nostoc sp. FACHB-190]MBD2458550.1 hypothetical protein [Nostoc sp. FACHB-87]MBD2479630.1 hypothetical protein [Anabaena sp. FACHB-83]MBD2492710.1 hypothetical protein [Aulosira sp. FACHB-615]